MAVKWAVANGNWNTGATWNDGVVPVSGDEVYLNGHTVTHNNNISIRKLSNEEVSEYNIANGGNVAISGSNRIVTAQEIVADGSFVIQFQVSSNDSRQYINGKISSTAPYVVRTYNQANSDYFFNGNIELSDSCGLIANDRNNYPFRNLSITGNVENVGTGFSYILCALTANNSPSLLTIVGNIYNVRYYSASNLTISSMMHTGNYTLNTEQNINTYTISGSLFATNNAVFGGINLSINGSIAYESTNNKMGVRYTNLNILNPDTFTWKDVTEPRSNPFIIVTDAEMNNRQQYPAENEVKEGTEYVWGEKIGTYQQPPESVVLKGYRYDNDEKEGTLENQNIVGCVTKEDVREGVALLGMGEVGTLVVPSVDDVREGVVFDNGSVGTLIVQGGGDRLRIADFGYYTNAQSDTYIVDLTEQDKPKFAIAEERVLIEMFPDLDLENIPEKYFDDLFVKYLKYRLIVEYYRTAGINSTFTPSEPVTEIVNYQNVRNEVWLNSANIYLKAWSKKYPDCITRPQRILL